MANAYMQFNVPLKVLLSPQNIKEMVFIYGIFKWQRGITACNFFCPKVEGKVFIIFSIFFLEIPMMPEVVCLIQGEITWILYGSISAIVEFPIVFVTHITYNLMNV